MIDIKYDTPKESRVHTRYKAYLQAHRENIWKGYDWFLKHLPDLLDESNYAYEPMYFGRLEEIIAQHDASKYKNIPDSEHYYELSCEFDPYAYYHCGEPYQEVSEELEYTYNRAWLAHVHANPHHWQHWKIAGKAPLQMPYVFVIEMILDWWSFSWSKNNLYEIFDWYLEHRDTMELHPTTKQTVENILTAMRAKLNELNEVE